MNDTEELLRLREENARLHRQVDRLDKRVQEAEDVNERLLHEIDDLQRAVNSITFR